MTYASFAASTESGQPVELFAITLGASSYYYTSAEDSQTVGGITYLPLAITREKLSYTQESRANLMTLTLPSTEPFVRLFLLTIPGQRARVTIYQIQRQDTPTPQAIFLFTGFVQSVTFESKSNTANIAVAPEGSALSRPVPRATYMSSCNNLLGDERCKVDLNAFKFVSTVTAVSGNTITVLGANAFPAGYFAAGECDTPGALDRRLILAHTGSLVTLLLPFGVSPIGSTVTLFPGCGHDPDTCFTTFANTINYYGFFCIPHKNPFDTGLS